VNLTGANTYTGGTVVNGGVLSVNNATGSGTGLGPVTVNTGGILAGGGTIAGAVMLSNGGAVSPLVVMHGSSLTWNGGGTFNFRIGTTADELILSGALTKGTTGTYTINLINMGVGTTPTTETLMTFASTTFKITDFNVVFPIDVTGTLAFNAGHTALEIDNLHDPPPPPPAPADEPTIANPNILTAPISSDSGPSDSGFAPLPTPEPGSGALLLVGLTTLTGRRRRRLL
jgi:autotransporter-associated beta strand protein